MNIETQKAHFARMVHTMNKVMFSKGNDYANEDRLSNFKLGGAICGLTAEQHCLALIATKVARLGTLLSGNKEPNHESVSDSIMDMCNYGILLDMIISDRENGKGES